MQPHSKLQTPYNEDGGVCLRVDDQNLLYDGDCIHRGGGGCVCVCMLACVYGTCVHVGWWVRSCIRILG